jgi:hypothetical protein
MAMYEERGRMLEGAFSYFQRYSEKAWLTRPADFHIERTVRLSRGRREFGRFERRADHVRPSELFGLGRWGSEEADRSTPRLGGGFAGLLVGSYGTGKTEFAYRLCMSLREKSDESMPTPLPVSLARCRGRQALLDSPPEEAEFLDLLKEGLPEDLRDSQLWSELREAIRIGKVFLVLDALDELVERPYHHQNFISGLSKFVLGDDGNTAESRFRVLVTMRREYLSAMDGPKADGTLEAWTADRTDTLYLLELNQFGDSEIRQYFSRRDCARSREIFEAVAANPQVYSMLRRPLLLRIFADYLEEADTPARLAKALAQLSSAPGSLIDAYVEQVHQSGQKLQEELGSSYFWSKQKLADKSVEMFATGAMELDEAAVADIRAPLSGAGGNENPLVSVHKCPFLLRDGERVRFAHRTFFEFFVTMGIADEVKVKRKDLEQAEGFNNLVVNADMRKFLQYFLPDFYDLIKLSCGLLTSKGWRMKEGAYQALLPDLESGLQILTEGMTKPEDTRTEVEDKIDWFLEKCDPETFYPGYLVYCFQAVATYMLERPWAEKVPRWREKFEELLQIALRRALSERQMAEEEKDWLERLAERVLSIAQRLRYGWIQESTGDESWHDGRWHAQTHKRITGLLDDIAHTRF